MKYVENSFVSAMCRTAVYQNAIKQMAMEVDSFFLSFSDSPSHLSGWGHRYFCPDDGGRLIFDVTKPHEHVCSVCGKKVEGRVYDEAWVAFYRNLAFVTALKAAVVYRVNDNTHYLDISKSILSCYIPHYLSYPLHNKEGEIFQTDEEASWGCGRLMPQGLNESILMVRAIETLEILGSDAGSDFLQVFHEQFVRPFYQLIMPQVNKVHNIPCWNLSGLGAAALFFHDADVLDFVFQGEFNIRRQLREGVTQDGFWYEGSIHYNFFLLEGVSSLLVLAHVHDQDFGTEAENTIIKMLQAAYAYAFDNQTFPVPNDGWPAINLKTYSYVYYMVSKVFGEDSVVGNLVKNIENGKEKRGTLPLSESYYVNNEIPLERLLFAYDWDMHHFEPIKRSSMLFGKSNFAMLRQGKFNLFFKYGLNGPSHAHPDILEFELAYGKEMVSRDLSNAGYHSRLCNSWQRKTACHNSVTRDGEDITSREPGTLLSYSPDSVSASSELFSDVKATRTMSVTGHGLEDELSIKGKEEASYDLFLHIEKAFSLEEGFPAEPSILGYEGNGYEHFSSVRKYVGPKDACFNMRAGKTVLVLSFHLGAQEDLFIAQSPDNPASHSRLSFIRRMKGEVVIFKMSMEISEKIKS